MPSYNEVMTTNATRVASPDPAPSTAGPSMADAVLRCLGAGTFTQLAALFEPDIAVSALLPDGLHEWLGPEQVVTAFVRWFGRVDEYELFDTYAGHLGPRLHLRWQARVRGGSFGDATFVVQQHVYADPGPTGRIQTMSMLCSGFAEERGQV
jgi:hypothetical protein